MDVISSRHATGHPWVRARSEIVKFPARRSSEDGKNGQRTSLALRPEATTGCESSGGCDIAYTIGVRAWLVRAWNKYMVRATGCMKTSVLARHGRSNERSLQVTRNRLSTENLRGVTYNNSNCQDCLEAQARIHMTSEISPLY